MLQKKLPSDLNVLLQLVCQQRQHCETLSFRVLYEELRRTVIPRKLFRQDIQKRYSQVTQCLAKFFFCVCVCKELASVTSKISNLG